MEFDNGVLQLDHYFSFTLGIVVLFAGKRVNDAVGFLREFSIPEPVTGGLIATLLISMLFVVSGIEIYFSYVIPCLLSHHFIQLS